MPAAHLTHLTLNTGHSRQSPRSEVGPEAIQFCRELIANGGGELLPPWRCVITRGNGGAVFDVRRGKDQSAVLCGVAWTPEGAQECWPAIERTYQQITDAMAQAGALTDEVAHMPEMPEELPWLAVVLILGTSSAEDLRWMADFERCLAWALIEA